jgi:hypothetical protein
MWQLPGGKHVGDFACQDYGNYQVAFAAEAPYLVTSGADNVREWSIVGGAMVRNLDQWRVWSLDGKKLAEGKTTNAVAVAFEEPDVLLLGLRDGTFERVKLP